MHIHSLVLGDLDTNCYIVRDSAGRAMVIDPADETEKILAVVQEENLTVVAVVLTHAHFDHMMSAQSVCNATGAPLYVGRGDADAMTDPIRNLSGLFTLSSPITVTDYDCIGEADTVSVGDRIFRVLETPGHTPGCICLYGDGCLFSGDTLFEDSIGRLDFPGGDTAAMMSSLSRLMQLPPETKVFPGHGLPTTIGREIQYNPYLQ